MKNEYLILYAIADMSAYHFLSIEKAKLNENGDIVFIQDPSKFEKPEKRIYEIMMKAIWKLNKNLSKEAFNAVKAKYDKLLKGFKDSKHFKEYAPVLVAIALLNNYARVPAKKVLNIHPKSAEKILELTKESANFKYLDKFSINSFALGDKFFKEMTK